MKTDYTDLRMPVPSGDRPMKRTRDIAGPHSKNWGKVPDERPDPPTSPWWHSQHLSIPILVLLFFAVIIFIAAAYGK